VTKILVETQTVRLELPPGGLKLSNEETLAEIDVAYETYGQLDIDGKNAIFVCHALTGDAHAAFYQDDKDKKPGWWDTLIGPGKAIDTDRYYVVCSNILGGCKGTTGPASINPATGRPYGIKFPLITVEDSVQVEKLLLDTLGVAELYAIIGGSLGGMRALQWCVSYPDYVRRCICVASAVNLSPQALAFDIIARQEIECDPNWKQGKFYEDNPEHMNGLVRARQIGHVTYLSAASMAAKFGREIREKPMPGEQSKFSTSFQVESYLNYQGQKFVERFDANSYLYISRMMDMFDLEADYGSLREAFKHTQTKFLVVSISTDWLFPSVQQLEIVSILLSLRKHVSYFMLDSPYGHDAFLMESDTLQRGIESFLSGETPSQPADTLDHQDLELISEMLEDDMHVLDVGSGDGSLILALQEARNISGVCLDLDFDKVETCMRRGLSVIQLDADTGLSLIEDNAFDCVLLNQTIQQLHSALQTIKQLLRISDTGIVSFPNFAYYGYRLSLAFKGRLPVSKVLPFAWYDTPNIHLVTVRDFRDLCKQHDIHIAQMEYESVSLTGRLMLSLGLPNLGAERSLAKITRNHKTPTE
jgi:homoserine O-acetyltransferase/O-succinyltransferase